MSIASGLVGLILVTLGVVYLIVACQKLPGFLGPIPGDSSPRTPLGAGVLVIGVLVLGVAALLARRGRAR
ncbi:MAG TPA: hypothetical protein VGF70_04535 [Solirubrobacteraceae bacterium]|jgi:hypothetical protein